MPNLYQKLATIQSQTGQISKGEINRFQNYRYFTEQQALNILKPLLAEQKLTLTFDDIYEPNQAISQKTEKEWMVNYPKRAILTNSEDPLEQLTFHFWAIGSNSDPAKAKGCAETYAVKHFLTKFFLIPTTDELDPDVTKQNEHLNRLANGKKETPQNLAFSPLFCPNFASFLSRFIHFHPKSPHFFLPQPTPFCPSNFLFLSLKTSYFFIKTTKLTNLALFINLIKPFKKHLN